jgi:putative transposase
LDGYELSIGFIHVDLRPLQSIKILYERKKAIAQSKGRGELCEEYVRRERDREKDFINKPSAGLRRILLNSVCVFEDLDKEDMVNRKKRGKKRGKENARTPWRWIHRRMSEATLTASVDPRNASRESQMWVCRGDPRSNEPEEAMKVELWVGVTPSGRSPAIWIPMK